MSLLSNHALVVGGATGLGAAIVAEIAHERPLLPCSVPEQAWVANLYMSFEMDVRDDESIRHYLESKGPLSHIVYTPGINKLEMVNGDMRDSLQRVFDTNVFGFVQVLGIYKDLFGLDSLQSVVAIVSDAARNPMRGSLAYCSSKAALAMAVRTVAREWAGEVRVNGVAPAVIDDTPLSAANDSAIPELRGWTPEEAKAYEMANLPLGRRATKREVAKVVTATLFGPDYQTGSIVDITGGK